MTSTKPKFLYYNETTPNIVENINPYLIDAPDVLITSRSKPICAVPPMVYGNKPADGGNLILSIEEKDALLSEDSSVAGCVKRYIGARDFLNNDQIRYPQLLLGVCFCAWRYRKPKPYTGTDCHVNSFE